MRRKKFVTDAEIRAELQKRVWPALNVIDKQLKRQQYFDAWKVVDKFVSNKATTELTGKDGDALPIFILSGGYIPPNRSIADAPEGSNLKQITEVQDSSVAPQGAEDDHSDSGTGKTESD